MDLCCFRKRRSSHAQQRLGDISTANNVRLFSFNELRSATKNFSSMNKVGGGGFGVVYKLADVGPTESFELFTPQCRAIYMGILRDETQVAVKSLSAESSQGVREFLTELDMISNIRHPNLVQLLGCCIEGSNRMLVYEYMENNSLASALLGPKSRRIALDWPTRASICMGTARGLEFLHEEAEPHIVHRDIKASNVLLDGELVPKIGDFGLAKLFPDNVTHISTRVAGTMGYLAPEYAQFGQLTKKADIYSFGVLILEIVSGRSGTKAAWGEEMMVLLEWTWKLREGGRLLEIVDPELEAYPEDAVLRFIKVALFCTQAVAQQRPSMRQVIEMLSDKITLSEKMLTKPGILRNIERTKKDSGGSSSSSQGQRMKGSTLNTTTLITSTNVSSSPLSVTDVLPR